LRILRAILPQHEELPLANSPQARKRARQNDARRARNHSQTAAMRTAVKRFLQSLQGEGASREKSAATYATAASAADRMARKGRQHKNKAARLKSRLNKRFRAAEFS